MRTDNIIASIDIGTTKICAVVCEYDKAENKYHILGVGNVPSRGLHKGSVVNIPETKDAIKSAMSKAQNDSGTQITQVTIGIAGEHINSLDSEATVILKYKEDPNDELPQVTEEDIEKALENAKAINLDAGREIIHVIPQFYKIDNDTETQNPVGMAGSKLSLNAHIIHASTVHINNLKKSVQSTGLNVANIILEPLASADAVLNEDQKSLGVALVDIGGGTSDISVYKDGYLHYTGVISFGGAIITRDIAQIVQISPQTAESIKMEKAWATRQQAEANGIEEFKVPSVNGSQEKYVSSYELSEYVEARIVEILMLVKANIAQHIAINELRAGIVLTGGGSLLKGLDELASDILGVSTVIGQPRKVPGLEDTKLGPEYATALGLLLYSLPQNGKSLIHIAQKGFWKKIIKIYKYLTEELF